jgi:hypothetical protein
MAAPKSRRPVRYTLRWAVALSVRDVQRVKQAAEALDITSSELMRTAIRKEVARVLPAGPLPLQPSARKAKHDQRAPVTAAA